jgi:penicillin amidase
MNPYFDRMETIRKETAEDIVTEAFIAALLAYDATTQNGRKSWGDINRVDVMHMTQVPAFSVMNLRSAGNPEAVDAMSRSWGPSWRMVVELGKRPVGYGIYPGGQSGNPGSRYYDDFVGDWNKGKYYPLLFFMSMDEARVQCKTKWTLQ